jgi:hypothetical protein
MGRTLETETYIAAREKGSMNIGILGSGRVGSSLATGFSDSGHTVMLGSRNPTRPELADWADDDPAHRAVGDYREATLFGALVILAVPGRVLGETLDNSGRETFSGKLVIDATNPIVFTDDGAIDAYGDDDSGAEFVQRELPDAAVVKAFNQINAADMLDPERSEMKVLRIAGDDEDAKRQVTELLESFGWRVRDLGPLRRSRALEHSVVDWVTRPGA